MSDAEQNNEEEQVVDVEKEKERVAKVLEAGLGQIGKTADNSGYSFVSLKASDKEIGASLYGLADKYQHVRYVDLSKNGLQTVTGLQTLPHLVYLNLRANQLNSLCIFQERNRLAFLQYLDLQENQIQELQDLSCQNLQSLNLNQNAISHCSLFTGHASLKVLELRKNALVSLNNLAQCPALTELYLAENQVASLDGLQNLPALQVLHLRDNKLTSLDSLDVKQVGSLRRLNVRQNQLEKFSCLPHLLGLPALKDLNILGNPCTEEGADTQKETLMILQGLQRLNKEEVKPEDLEEAQRELKERIAAEEEKKRQEEEERRIKQEELEAEQREKEAAEAAERAEREAAEKEAAEKEAAEQEDKEEDE